MTNPIRSRIRSNDRGASLVLVLAISIVVSLVMAAMVYASMGNILYAQKLGTPEIANTDVDNALAAAVNQIRRSTYNDNITQNCAPFSMVGANGGGGASNVAVTCTSQAGTGDYGRVVSTAANKPARSILTLGTTETPGIDILGSSGLKVFGEGTGTAEKVASNSPITVAGPGTLAVSGGGTVWAKGTCTGTITPASPNCSAGNTAITDPGYPQPQPPDSYPLQYKTVCDDVDAIVTCNASGIPTGCTPGGVVKLLPGYYDNASALSSLMSQCSGRTIWFQGAPGGATYYFDFHNGETPATTATFPATPPTACATQTNPACWIIANTNLRIVAGGTTAPAAYPPPIPGSCPSPVNSTTNGGVNFVFGGRSELVISNGQLEICGQYSVSTSPIAIYGAPTGADAITNSTSMHATDWASPTGSAAATGCSGAPNVSFVTPLDASYLDGSTTTVATFTSGAPQRACLKNTLGLGPNAPTTIPAGSVLSNATLVVTHRESADQMLRARITPSATTATQIPPETGVPLCSATGTPTTVVTVPDEIGASLVTDTVDVTAQLFARVHDCGFSGSVTDYLVTRATNTSTATVDTIQLNMTFKAPGVRAQTQAITTQATGGTYLPAPGTAQSGPGTTVGFTFNANATGGPPVATANCVGAPPYPTGGDSTHCAFIKTSGTATTKFYSQGTVYTPNGALDLALTGTGVTKPIFPYGLIARKLAANITPTTSPLLGGFNGTSIVLPPDTLGAPNAPPTPVNVYLRAYQCVAGVTINTSTTIPTCSAVPATLAGTARVTYTYAAPPVVPVPGSRDVSAKDWNIAP